MYNARGVGQEHPQSRHYAQAPQNQPSTLTADPEALQKDIEDDRKDGRLKLLNSIIGAAFIAMLVINALAIAGILPGSTVGWATAGLSLGSLSAAILRTKIQRAPVDAKALTYTIISAVVYLSLGIAGGTGALAASKLGWACVGIPLGGVALPLGCVALCSPCIIYNACTEEGRENMRSFRDTMRQYSGQ